MNREDPSALQLAASPSRLPGETGTAFPMTISTDGRPGFWQMLRSFVGKDLSRVSMPIWLNEPLSFLQRAAEDLEYSDILDRAAAAENAVDRAGLVAAFAVSHYSSTAERIGKPFNPLLGETFEFVSHERNLAFVAEQVSHHPPISAAHASGAGWVYETSHEIHNRFHGNSLDVWPDGQAHVYFPEINEHYVYKQVRTTVHNILGGHVWLDNAGKMTIEEVSQGFATIFLHFKRCSLFFGETKTVGEVTGELSFCPSSGESVRYEMVGNWKEFLACNGDVLWRAASRPLASETAGHNLTAWAWSLNCPVTTSTGGLPRTDSRFRPDQRLYEGGYAEAASAEKLRLEQKQRSAAKDRKENGEEYEPKWFKKRSLLPTDAAEWCYTGRYFAERINEEPLDNVPDIF